MASLAGKRVLVTRASSQASELCALLKDAAANPIEIPVIEIRPLLDGDAAQATLERLPEFDWLIFTSTNAIRYFFRWRGATPLPPALKIACVGRKSAEALQAFGRSADFVPQQFAGEFLAEQIELTGNERILLPGPKTGNREFVSKLRSRCGTLEVWPIYETVAITIDDTGRRELETGFDVVTFASPSAVDSFCDQIDEFEDYLRKPIVACIGPMTERRLNERGVRADLVPDPFTLPALVEALVDRVPSLETEGRHVK